MIELTCACRQYRFSLPDDMAGGLIQCPRCRRLCDVPSLGEITQLDESGGYKVETPYKATDRKPDHFNDAARAFGRERLDQFGDEIDLRPTLEDVQRAGIENASGMPTEGRPVAPKYDPVTGELIRPLTIKDEQPRRVLPLEPDGSQPEEVLDAIPVDPPRLAYAVVPAASFSLARAFISLLRPVNLIVMSFILLGHFFLHISCMIVFTGFFLMFFVPALLLFGLVGHYGNVIDETGPGGCDELPTPLRNVGFVDDIWRPFVQIFTALFLSYLPVICIERMAIPMQTKQMLELGFLCLGSLAAPAMVLTQVTSGTFENLRPDRVMGVIGACGAKYFFICLVYAAAMAVYGVAIYVAGDGMRILFALKTIPIGLTTLAAGYGVLAVGIYLMHVLCMQLGILYRLHHDQFPWVMQRHIPTKMRDRTRPTAGHLLPPSKPTKPPLQSLQ